jgi:hypothetical protein
MTDETGDNNSRGVRVSRRQLLSMGAVAGVAVGTATIPVTSSATTPATKPMPEVNVASLDEIKAGSQRVFGYPDSQSPAILLRLDGPVEGGVGPDHPPPQIAGASPRDFMTAGEIVQVGEALFRGLP